MSNSNTSPSEFTHILTRISVAQILKSTGFNSTKSTALETLTRLTTLFLHHLCSSSAAAISTSQPSLHHLISALHNLHLPLDFSLSPLSRFVRSHHHRPFPRLVPVPDHPLPLPPLHPGGSGLTRGPEIPEWLPGFPVIEDDSDGDGCGGEVYWEERRPKSCGAAASSTAAACMPESRKGKRKGGVVVFGKRERVKFRLGSVKKPKIGNVDDMELKTGVCRGGKRISLLKRLNSRRWFEYDDDDENEAKVVNNEI